MAIEFAIIGAGWRTEFFMRIARALPDRFRVLGVVARNPEKAAAFTAAWDTPTCGTLDELLEKTSPRFVVTSVSWEANPTFLKRLVDCGMPALSETPPAPDLPGLIDLWEHVSKKGGTVQVAEQLHLRPHHAAQIAAAHSGRIGTPSQAQVSAAHGYHGISLVRRILGLQFEDCTITARRFISPIVKGAGRSGPPDSEKIQDSEQQIVWFNFGDKLGVLDFTGDQYFGWIRNERVLIRGERGEIIGDDMFALKDHRTPLHLSFQRHAAGINGNLEGNTLNGIQLGDEWIYTNPFQPASLSDDEIAIATALKKMARCVDTGEDFYSLAEGSQDHYLSLCVNRALESGEDVRTEPQPWSA